MASNLKEHPKVLALVVVAAVVLSSGLAYTYWPTGMPTMPETMADVPTLLESRAYSNLTPEQRRPYVERVSELMRNSDREQRRELMQNSEQSRDAMRDMFKQMMVDRAKQFALADDAARAQMLAQDRARMEAMMKRRGEGKDSGARGDRPEPTEEQKQARRDEHESRIEGWVNQGNGQDWALMQEYMQQLMPGK